MEMSPRDMARMLGVGRFLMGLIMLVAPRKALRGYTGADNPTFPATMIARGFGARDVALATGLLVELENDGDVSRWLEAGALADAGDVLSTLAHFRELPTWRRLIWILTAGGATFLGLKLAGELD